MILLATIGRVFLNFLAVAGQTVSLEGDLLRQARPALGRGRLVPPQLVAVDAKGQLRHRVPESHTPSI